MLTDVAILLGLGFAAGYGLRAWISTRRRRAIRKAVAIERSAADVELPVGCRRSVEAWKGSSLLQRTGRAAGGVDRGNEYTQVPSLPSRDRGRSREM